MKTIQEIMLHALHRKRVTFRRWTGPDGTIWERPLCHRFEVKGGISHADLVARNLTSKNRVFQHLTRSR